MTFPNTSTDIPDELLSAQEEGKAALKLLAMLTDFAGTGGHGLNQCLDKIASSPQNVNKLEESNGFRRLREVASSKEW